MAAYDYDKVTDGIVIDGVPYVCIDHPKRPRIEGPLPEGIITYGIFQLQLAPESSVKMYTKCDGDPLPRENLSRRLSWQTFVLA